MFDLVPFFSQFALRCDRFKRGGALTVHQQKKDNGTKLKCVSIHLSKAFKKRDAETVWHVRVDHT